MNRPTTEERLIQLESLSAMQDQTISHLNTEIFTQQKMIRRLETQLKLLENRILQIPSNDSIAGQEKPPHY